MASPNNVQNDAIDHYVVGDANHDVWALFAPLTVNVTRPDGSPAPAGQAVKFTCSAAYPDCWLYNINTHPVATPYLVVLTNANGQAVLSSPLVAGYTNGQNGLYSIMAESFKTYTVTASSDYSNSTAVASLTYPLPPPPITTTHGCLKQLTNNSIFTWTSAKLGVTIAPGGTATIDWFNLYAKDGRYGNTWLTGGFGDSSFDLSIAGSTYSTTVAASSQNYTWYDLTQGLSNVLPMTMEASIILGSIQLITDGITSKYTQCASITAADSAHLTGNTPNAGDVTINGGSDGFPTITIASGNGQSVYLLPANSSGPPLKSFGPLQVVLKDGSGRPLPNVAVSWACAPTPPMRCQLGPATTTNTNNEGIAALTGLTATGGSGPLNVTATAINSGLTLTAIFQLRVDPPPTLSVYAGNNQVAVLSTAPGSIPSFNPISVKITDASGNPVPNVPVNFTCMGCGFNGPATSDANGIATMNLIASRLLSIPGSFTATASSPAANPASVTFNLAIQPPPLKIILSGNNQGLLLTGSTPPGGVANFAPLTATITDGYGNPIVCAPGSASGCAQVTWTCFHPGAMICQIDPSSTTAPSTTTTTDSAGTTTLNKINGASISACNGTGSITVTASYGKLASATFNLTVATPPPPPSAALNVLSGNPQTVTRVNGTAAFQPLSVILIGPTFQPTPGQTVIFSCSAPSGLTCQPATVSAKTEGRAGSASWRGLKVSGNGAGGVVTVTAQSAGASSAIFQLTVQ